MSHFLHFKGYFSKVSLPESLSFCPDDVYSWESFYIDLNPSKIKNHDKVLFYCAPLEYFYYFFENI